MGRPSSDMLLRSMLVYAINDLRKNPWLLADIFDTPFLEKDLLSQPLKDAIDAENATKWFLSNKIHVFQALRRDKSEFPCLTIALSSSSERVDQASIGDYGAMTDIDPRDLQRPMVRIYNEFSPTAYDATTGAVTMPSNLSTGQIAPGLHLMVDASNGSAYQIQKCIDSQTFAIAPNTVFDSKSVYIIPITKAWRAQRGRARMSESYEIGVHVSSDPVQAIWLSQIVEYILFKYKNQFLENRGLELSTFSSSDVSQNQHYQADTVMSRFFRLSFQVEMDWIETVAPRVGVITGNINIIDAPKTPDALWNYNVKNEIVHTQGDEGRE